MRGDLALRVQISRGHSAGLEVAALLLLVRVPDTVLLPWNRGLRFRVAGPHLPGASATQVHVPKPFLCVWGPGGWGVRGAHRLVQLGKIGE